MMNILLRYACLLGLGLASLSVFINAGSMTGQMVMASGDAAPVDPGAVSLWVLGAIAGFGLFSLARSFFRMPLLVRDWYYDHRGNLATMAMVSIICLIFVVF